MSKELGQNLAAHRNREPRAKITVITQPNVASRKCHNAQALIHVGQTNQPSSLAGQLKVTPRPRNLMSQGSYLIERKRRTKFSICSSKIPIKFQSRKLKDLGRPRPTLAWRKSTLPNNKNLRVSCNQSHSKWCSRHQKQCSQPKNHIIQAGPPINHATVEVQLGLKTHGKDWLEPPNWSRVKTNPSTYTKEPKL